MSLFPCWDKLFYSENKISICVVFDYIMKIPEIVKFLQQARSYIFMMTVLLLLQLYLSSNCIYTQTEGCFISSNNTELENNLTPSLLLVWC